MTWEEAPRYSPCALIRVHYLGHAAFVLQFGSELTVVCDYGAPNAWLEWGWDSPIHDIGDLVPDVITTSHTEHDDHYDVERWPDGVTHRLTGQDRLEIHGLLIEPFRTCEKSVDEADNTSFLFSYQGLRVLHLGDCQADIQAIDQDAHRERIRSRLPQQVDLLLMPIESQEQFDGEAARFLELLNPRIVVPMHYWSRDTLDALLSIIETSTGERIVVRSDACQLEISERLSQETKQAVSLRRSPFRGWQDVRL